jgi:hypothetical protein
LLFFMESIAFFHAAFTSSRPDSSLLLMVFMFSADFSCSDFTDKSVDVRTAEVCFSISFLSC